MPTCVECNGYFDSIAEADNHTCVIDAPFEIKVGSTYINGLKQIVMIIGVEVVGVSTHTHVGNNGQYYNKRGESLNGHPRYHLSDFDPIVRIKELEECLKHTRQLISNCAVTGFTVGDDIDLLYRNNGAITKMVPMTPEERVTSSAELNKRM